MENSQFQENYEECLQKVGFGFSGATANVMRAMVGLTNCKY